MDEDKLLATCVRLRKISEDLQKLPKATERETAYEIGYRVALDTVMQEIRPGIDWSKRVDEYRMTGEIHVEY